MPNLIKFEIDKDKNESKVLKLSQIMSMRRGVKFVLLLRARRDLVAVPNMAVIEVAVVLHHRLLAQHAVLQNTTAKT